MSSNAHKGAGASSLSIEQGVILPVDFQDTLFPFHWNTSTRGIFPTQDISTIVPDSKFTQVVAVENSTTNLWYNGGWQDGSLSGWTSTSSGSSTGNTVVEADKTFGYILRLEKTDTGTGRWGTVQNKTWSSSGSKITDSFYIKRVSNSSGAQLVLYSDYLQTDSTYNYGAGISIDLTNMTIKTASYATSSSITYVGNGWYYVTYISQSSTITSGSSYYWIDGNSASVRIAYSQKEAANWASSFVSESRPIGYIRYTKEIFPTDDFTVNMWIAHTGDTRTSSTSYKLFALGTDVNACKLTLWNYAPLSTTDTRKLIADYGLSSDGYRQYSDLVDNKPFVANVWEMLTVTYDSVNNKYSFYRNGLASFTASSNPPYIVSNSGNTAIPNANNPITSIELYNSGWKYSNLLICPRVVPLEEIQTWYEYGRPFYDPYDYTAIYA